MAIHQDHPGLKAEVLVNGVPLKEYDDDGEQQPGVVTKYVEVNADAPFGVSYIIPKGLTGECGTRSALDIDGKAMGRHTHQESSLEKWDRSFFYDCISSEVNGMLYTQKFRFSSLQIGEQLDQSSLRLTDLFQTKIATGLMRT